MSRPERTCVGCRARCAQDELRRFVLVDGALVEGRGLPGRGAWLHPEAACFQLASKRGAFARALRAVGPIDSDQVRSRLVGPEPG